MNIEIKVLSCRLQEDKNWQWKIAKPSPKKVVPRSLRGGAEYTLYPARLISVIKSLHARNKINVIYINR